jgi:hypothetical protein
MDAGITKQFARFLSGCSVNQLPEIYKEFNNSHIPHHDFWTGRDKSGKCVVYGLDEKYENIILENDADNKDKQKIDAQTNYLEAYISRYVNEYKSKGKLYQAIYRLCNKKTNSVKIDTFVDLKNTTLEENKNHYSAFMNRYKKIIGKNSVSHDQMFILHQVVKKNYKLKLSICAKREQEILKEIENFKYYLVENDKRKAQIVNKYNEEFRKLLKIDSVGLEKNADIPSFDELVKALNNDDFNKYLKLQACLALELQELSKQNFNVEYNMKLIKLKAVYKTQACITSIYNFVTNYITNTKDTFKKMDVDSIASEMAKGLKLTF